MNLPFFVAPVDFSPPTRGGAHGNSPVGYRQDGLRHARHPNLSTFGFPKILKLLWLKSPFARKIVRFIYNIVFITQ
jgi:hypothetical protein